MSVTKREVLGCLGVIGLVLVGTGTFVVLNWDTVSKNLDEALDKQAGRTQTTLFRLGELMSIGAELKAQYGTEPDLAYDTGTGDRILSISFSNYPLPEEATAKGHAREIAVFAIGKTTKFEQIDAVKVLFQSSSKTGVIETTSGPESYSFSLDDLMPNQPQAKPVEPDHPAAE